MQTPVRPTIRRTEGNENISAANSSKRTTDKRSYGKKPWGNTPDQERRLSQREKQVSYGYATTGYLNMIELVNHDPLLKSGGILPLQPPDVDIGSKRTWDVLVRKWRRALHMFDFVFIEGKDEDSNTLESTVEAQRLQWVSPAFQSRGKDRRVRLSTDEIMEARSSQYVPTRLPVEENLKFILRSEDCYEPVSNVVPPGASSLTKGTDISPLDAGIKIHVAPSTVKHSMTSPGKYDTQSLRETPAQAKTSAVDNYSKEKTPSGALVFPSPQTSRPCIGNISGYCIASSLNYSIPCELSFESPFVPPSQSIQRNSSVFLTPLRNDWLFAPPSCASHTKQGYSISPANIDRICTPATAPRRVTLLQSTGHDRKLGEASPRNLFHHIASSANALDERHQGCSGVLTKQVYKGTSESLQGNKTEYHVDSVSQELFPER